jgi:membrane-associated protease RseP (regulator of RpoE activity)
VTVLRHGKQIELAVRIGDPKEAAKWLGGSVEQRLGVKSRPLTSKETEKYGLNRQQGVGIISIAPNGPLGQVGFEVGDMILEINGQTIEDVESLSDLLTTLQPGQRKAMLALDHHSGNRGCVEAVLR